MQTPHLVSVFKIRSDSRTPSSVKLEIVVITLTMYILLGTVDMIGAEERFSLLRALTFPEHPEHPHN